MSERVLANTRDWATDVAAALLYLSLALLVVLLGVYVPA
jgi:hypothetical protein